MKFANRYVCEISKKLSADGHLNVVRLEPLPTEGETNTRLLIDSPIGKAEIGQLLLPNGEGFAPGKVYELEIREVQASAPGVGV